MKNIFIAAAIMVGFLAIPVLVSAESPCDYEFIRYGRQYCVIKAEGRRGTTNYKPLVITSEIVKKVFIRKAPKVIKKQPERIYRPIVSIKYIRETSRQRRARAREAYRNFRK